MRKYNFRIYEDGVNEDGTGEFYLGRIELENSMSSRELAKEVQRIINTHENPAGKFIRV